MAVTENTNKKVLNDLHSVMELLGEGYFFKRELKQSDLADFDELLKAADFEMPISEEGVTMEVGDPDVTRKKITEGRNWITFAKRGDDNFTMQVPSFDDSLNELFMHTSATDAKVKIGDSNFQGNGYQLKPKKVPGSWLFMNPEHTIVVILPNTENYGTLKGASGDNEGYYNVVITPMANAANVELYILHKVDAQDND